MTPALTRELRWLARHRAPIPLYLRAVAGMGLPLGFLACVRRLGR